MEKNIKPMNLFVRIITFGWAIGITLAPFGIYIRKDCLHLLEKGSLACKAVIKHEKIHWRQQMELGILPFYILYFLNWLILVIVQGFLTLFTSRPFTPYKSICFEREANAHEYEIGYLDNRKWGAWFKYITLF